MALYTKFNRFVTDVANGVHDLGSDTLQLALTDTAPLATHTVLSEITQSIYTNLNSPFTLTTISSTANPLLPYEYELKVADFTISAAGGDAAAFRYIVVYNATTVHATDPLIGWWDYGSSLPLLDGQSLDIDIDALTNRLLTFT